MNDVLQAVIAANRDRQAQARRLNTRAGEKLFAVLTQGEMSAWVAEKIPGARCAREVSDPEALRLPAFDHNLIDKVVRENPDSIDVLGMRLPVTYADGNSPSVVLGLQPAADRSWRNLPDDGIRLPGGRAVSVVIGVGFYGLVSGTDTRLLKAQLRDRLNRQQWESWWRKPALQLPNLAAGDEVIPEVVTVQYGTCVVEGTPLYAYGAVAVNHNRYYPSDPWFEGKWYLSKEEAETVRSNSVSSIGALAAKFRDQLELTVLKGEERILREKLGSFFYRSEWYNLDRKIQREVEDKLSLSHLAPTSATELLKRNAEIKALIARVESAVQEVVRSRTESALENARQRTGERLRRDVVASDFHSFGGRVSALVSGDEELIDRGYNHATHDGKFADVGNRWFRCPQGHTLRADKAVWSRYQQGETISLACGVCGSNGTASR